MPPALTRNPDPPLCPMPASLDQVQVEIRAEQSPSWPLKNTAPNPKEVDSAPSLRRRFSRLISMRSRLDKNTPSFSQYHSPELNASSTADRATRTALSSVTCHETKSPDIAESYSESERKTTSISASPLELRRVASTYQDLRGLAHSHRAQSDTTSSFSSPSSSPASPAFDGTKMQQLEQSLFRTSDFQSPQHKRCSSSYNSYENLHILSCYEDTKSQQMEDDRRAAMLIEAISADGPSTSSSNTDTQSTSDRHTSRSYSVSSSGSSEARWLANTTTHQQRQRRFNARCYRVIQYPSQENSIYGQQGNNTDHDDGKIMLARVLVGHGKAKLVQIQKPPSIDSSVRARVCSLSSKCSTSNSQVDVSQPRTPTREMSSFDPYDTPSGSTDCSELSQIRYHQPNLFSEQFGGRLRTVDDQLTGQQELRNSKSLVSSTGRSKPNARLPANVKYPGSAHLTRSSAKVARPSTFTATLPALPKEKSSASLFHPLASTTSIISSTISTVIQVAALFPISMLTLTSPAINMLRSAPTGEKDRQLMSSLSKVFPKASDSSLSALASWQIIDIYFNDLRSDLSKAVSSNELGKARKPPRITRAPSLSASIFTRRIKPRRLLSDSSGVTVSMADLRNCAPVTSPQHLQIARPQIKVARYSDHIPSKARALLGIDSSTIDTDSRFLDQTDNGVDSRQTLSQITDVQCSVKAVAKKLMELLNTDSGLRCKNAWDEELWTAMGVVVRLIEGVKRTDIFMKQEDGELPANNSDNDRHTRVYTIGGDERSLTSFIDDSDYEEDRFNYCHRNHTRLPMHIRGRYDSVV